VEPDAKRRSHGVVTIERAARRSLDRERRLGVGVVMSIVLTSTES
jgi:hypothetical protein